MGADIRFREARLKTLLTNAWKFGISEPHPPTQETTALAVEECVTTHIELSAINLLCFGRFRLRADDPPKP